MPSQHSLKIIRLAAENVKRLRAVQITPEGHIVQISGPNAAGKTSVLDCIWYALGGGSALPEQPIRKGAAKGEIHLDLGEMLVSRTFTQSGSYLKVVSKDGRECNSPQKLLDSLLGKLAFDPLAFARLGEDRQRELLMTLVSIPLVPEHLERISGVEVPRDDHPIAAMNAVYKTVYDQRAELNKNVKRLEAALATVRVPPGMEDLKPVSASGLLAERRALAETNAANEAARRAWRELERDHQAHQVERERLRQVRIGLLQQLEEVESALADRERLLTAAEAELRQAAETVAALVDRDLGEIDARIARADEVNRIATEAARKRALTEELERDRQAAADRTARLEAIARYKTDLMERTDFPIQGLDFQAGRVTYNGVPIGQASAAEKLRVGMAVAMALNPRLRIIRIEDGSLLDRQSWRVIEDMARRGDFQVWIETVADQPGQGIFIYDGETVNRSIGEWVNRKEAMGWWGGQGAIDLRSLPGSDEFGEHGADLTALILDGREILGRYEADFFCDFELSEQFAQRSLGDVEEAFEIRVGVPFVAFADVAGNRHRRSLHLILQAIVPG